MKEGRISMSTKELNRLHMIKKAEEKLITQKKAAEILNISERQFRRLIAKFRKKGPSGIIHALRGKPSKRKFAPDFIDNIVKTYEKQFTSYGPTYFSEKLAEEFNIIISKESVRKILISNSLWSPKKRKVEHRSKRERKHHPGELVQFDGSVHQWFPGKEGYCALMLYIDDATSRVFARFYPYEGTLPAMDSFRRYISLYGIPSALYTDRHSTYKNLNKKPSIEEQLNGISPQTQFSRALRELSVSIIYAYSPQAKGRVERTFKTFQDRLVKELHRHNITSIKEANAFLSRYLKEHNKRFSVKPISPIDFHRPSLPLHMLKKALCKKTERSIGKDFTIMYNRRIFQLKQSTVMKKALVEEHTNGSIIIRINNKSVPFSDVTHKFIKNKKTKKSSVLFDPVSLKEIA